MYTFSHMFIIFLATPVLHSEETTAVVVEADMDVKIDMVAEIGKLPLLYIIIKRKCLSYLIVGLWLFYNCKF